MIHLKSQYKKTLCRYRQVSSCIRTEPNFSPHSLKSFLRCDPPVFDRCGKDDQRLCPSEPLQFPDKLIQFHCTRKEHLQHHGIIPCDAVAFNHISAFLDERIKFFFIFRRDLQIDQRLDMISQHYRVNLCMVSLDNSLPLHFLDPRRDSRGGER